MGATKFIKHCLIDTKTGLAVHFDLSSLTKITSGNALIVSVEKEAFSARRCAQMQIEEEVDLKVHRLYCEVGEAIESSNQ